jgi:hypothetical protein
VDKCIVDISACMDDDSELLESFEMLRSVYGTIRIIVLAAYRQTGDEFLTKCFSLGILDIINTDDFTEIRDELLLCIKSGKQFKDALKYKDAIPSDQLTLKHVIQKAVDRVQIAIAGSENNIGVTHNLIIMANYLKKQGFMVACIEYNDSGTFESICNVYREKMYEEGYFTLYGIDYYPKRILGSDLNHPYNFILLDMGDYMTTDKQQFERCEEKFIITGSKPWEIDSLNKIFDVASKDVLAKYHFCFNFTMEDDYEEIIENMRSLSKNVSFLGIDKDPFTCSGFNDADNIFQAYLPEKEEEEKNGFLDKWKKKKGKEK